MMLMNANEYLETVEQVKQEIRTAQYRAAVQVNCELLRLYHAIGTVINAHKVWGSKFVENLAADIKLSFPEMKGYSARNIKYMAKFAGGQLAATGAGQGGMEDYRTILRFAKQEKPYIFATLENTTPENAVECLNYLKKQYDEC